MFCSLCCARDYPCLWFISRPKQRSVELCHILFMVHVCCELIITALRTCNAMYMILIILCWQALFSQLSIFRIARGAVVIATDAASLSKPSAVFSSIVRVTSSESIRRTESNISEGSDRNTRRNLTHSSDSMVDSYVWRTYWNPFHRNAILRNPHAVFKFGKQLYGQISMLQDHAPSPGTL